MKILTCTSTGQPISLLKQIASSGEGQIWQTDLEGYFAKVYYSPHPERIRKLEVMVAHPPKDPNAHINHISFAWPKSILRDASGKGVGFLMPAIADSVDLLDVYNPQRRQKVLPGFNWLYLHTTAANIVSFVWAIHRAGYVLGDIKPQNILVNNCALPAVIDTDSFQVRDPNTGALYRCPVGSEGFTPPELLEQDLATVEQTILHDRFRLAVIIYLLLFGDQPFKGKWVGLGDSPEPNELLRRGFWAYAPNSLIQPGPLTIPLEVVHPAIQRCFLRCFNEGHTKPELRPTAEQWLRALKTAVPELKQCRKAKTHWYSQSYGRCYWCERRVGLGVDIFPAPPTLAHKAKTDASRRIEAATKTVRNQVAKQVPRILTRPRINVVSPVSTGITSPKISPVLTARTAIATINRGVVVSVPISGTNNPTINQLNWKKLGTAIASFAGLSTVLIVLSRSHIDRAEIAPTLFGILLCLGLVGICFLWLRVIDKYNL